MESIRNFGRSLLGLEGPRKRKLEEELPRGKEQLEDPPARVRRAKRARTSQPDPAEISYTMQMVSPIKRIWSWFLGGKEEGEFHTRTNVSSTGASAETIQAAAPTRFVSQGKEADEVKLIKVVNPRLEALQDTANITLDSTTLDTGSRTLDLGVKQNSDQCSSFQGFTTTAQVHRGEDCPLVTKSPGHRIRTGYEKSRQKEHLKTPNLKKRFKSGLTTAPSFSYRSTYEKIFNKETTKRKQQLATDYCTRLGEKEVYQQMLEKHLGGTSIVESLTSTIRSPIVTKRTTLFPRSTTPRVRAPLLATYRTSTALKPSPSSRSEDTMGCMFAKSAGTSPVLAKSRTEAGVEVVTETKSVEQEDGGVLSSSFLTGLRERYDISTRERRKGIERATEKKEFYHGQNQAAAAMVEERLENYLKITQVAYDPVAEKELGPVELEPITPAMEEVIRRANSSRGEVLVEEYNIPITIRDIKTLQGLNWLNDEVINFYLNMIVRRSQSKDNEFPSVFAFSTFFYPKLVDGSHDSVKRWTKKVDLFAQSMVLVPVHLGMHWCLAVLDIERKAINYYDSMGGNNNRCLNALSTYLAQEHKVKKGSTLDMSKWDKNLVKDIPQQMNGSDCGMFACKFSEYLSRRARISFSQADMPYFRRRMIYEIVKNDIRHP